MRLRLASVVIGGVILLAPSGLLAQPTVPATPGAAGGAAGAAGAAGASTGAAAGTAADAAAKPGPIKNLWTFLCPTKEQKDACKQKFCQSMAGQLVNSMLKPITMFSGGLMPDCCPPNQPTAADLAKPGDSAEGAAAQIQKSEAEAKARRAAVKYLGTVDCHYFPEAEAALVNALRTDTNECVRLEAALSLSRGCCCTKAIMEALTICVNGTSKDKHPSETSPRVRAVAYVALQRCLSCPTPPSETPQPEGADKPDAATVAFRIMPAYYRRVNRDVPPETIVADARAAIGRIEQAQLDAGFVPVAAPKTTALATGERDLTSIIRFAWQEPRPVFPTAAEPPLAPMTRPAPSGPTIIPVGLPNGGTR
jgi:hypothetical protein